MGENPRYEKTIQRGADDTGLVMEEGKRKVEFTGGWEVVAGGSGVRCRTWKIEGAEPGADGADIIIEAGGYTPIQLVQAAEVVVDTPEQGSCFACVMDTDGQIYVNYFDDEDGGQMVWSEGMVVCWIAETEVRLTEFEVPEFTPEMFVTVPEDATEFRGLPMAQFLETVKGLRNLVRADGQPSP